MKRFPVYRILRIILFAIKSFLQVSWFRRQNRGHWTKAVEEKWCELARKQAKEYKKLSLELEGLLIKLGQFLSTRADMMPRSFIKELEDLTDHVPSVPWEQAKQVLEEEWGGDYTRIVKDISEEPIASASIGEVYRAHLHSGEDVAVKIRRPRIEKIIHTDFKAIRIIMWMADRFTSLGKQTNLPALYLEIKRMINNELNFQKELKNGETFIRYFETNERVEVPKFYEKYSTRRVLVMEWKNGAKITDIDFLEKNQINKKRLAEQLLQTFIQQLLEKGNFHADPHGGNILIKEDGTIVLLDFGMIGSINENDRRSVQKIIEGIVMERYDVVVNGLEELRFLLPHADKSSLQQVIQELIDEYQMMNFAHANSFMVEQLMEDIVNVVQREPLQMPSEFAFFGRAVSSLTGVLYVLDPEADLFEMVKPVISEWVQDGEDESSRFNAKSILLNAGKSIVRLPYQLEDLLEEPKRERQRKHADAQKDRTHHTLLSNKREALLLFLIPFFTLHVSLFFERWDISWWFGGITVLMFLNYWRTVRHAKKYADE